MHAVELLKRVSCILKDSLVESIAKFASNRKFLQNLFYIFTKMQNDPGIDLHKYAFAVGELLFVPTKNCKNNENCILNLEIISCTNLVDSALFLLFPYKTYCKCW